jgi:hypothetical protein
MITDDEARSRWVCHCCNKCCHVAPADGAIVASADDAIAATVATDYVIIATEDGIVATAETNSGEEDDGFCSETLRYLCIFSLNLPHQTHSMQ